MSISSVTPLSSRSHSGRLLALLTAAVVVASLLSVPSSPAMAADGTASITEPSLEAGLLPADPEPEAVTLITGDTVLWSDPGDGSPRLEIEEAPRDYPVYFDRSGTPEDYYVIPTDAMEYVVDGILDEELFNIPGLIRQDLDDASTDELPVIVTFDHNRTESQLTREADQLPATNNPRPVDRINGAGVTINRGKASAFRQAVLRNSGRTSSVHSAAGGLGGAVKQIMLDKILQIDLAESVPQIGAPTAWDTGYTGRGVTVAVLDTGVDTTHPDLQGQVMAEANFTDEPDASDTHGHGTHVASTIAGTGAASDGTRKGVAPDAELLSGKVCNVAGKCQTSWIMAGMEWAARQGANIVNMSLGGDPTDGSDPLSQLVNQLSTETGTLFVISAGNSRCRLRVVGSPASADAALAVGAVDKKDKLASFSSCGPRVGDHAVKPEITAPGVSIVAARAGGTSLGDPVDDSYTSVNGTSMATPHVAGAAALLVQANPDLAWSDLKDALVSTATDGGYLWLQQGTGRVNVPAALNSSVYAQGTVNLGGVDGRVEQDITYTNRSHDDITLTLEAAITDLTREPFDGLALSTDTLTVPANGRASVTVIVESSEVPGMAFGGIVSATGDRVALRTGIGFGPRLHRVTVEVLDSNGDRLGTDTARDSRVSLIHDDRDRIVGGTDVYGLRTSGGVAIGHVPAGAYTIITSAPEYEPDTGELARESLLVEVEVDIDADYTLTLDARDATPIEVAVPREADKRNHQVTVIRELAGSGGQTFTAGTGGAGWPIYATPAPPGDRAPLRLFVTWTLAEPKPLQPLFGASTCSPQNCYSETPAYIYNLPILYENGIPDDLSEEVTRQDLVEVPTRFHSEYPDALIRQQFQSFPPFSFPGEIPGGPTAVGVWFRPGEVTEYFLADDRFAWVRVVRVERRPEGKSNQSFRFSSDDRFPAAEAGARRAEERWFDAPMRVGMWDVREESLGWLRDDVPRVATAVRGGLDGDQFAVPSHAMGNTRGQAAEVSVGASWRMWNVDTDTELEPSGNVFPLEPGKATYRLEQIEAPVASRPFLTGPATTTWTFSSGPSDAPVPRRYLCWIRQEPREDICQIQPLILLEYELGLDIYNRVSAGRAHRFTVIAGQHSKAIDRAKVTDLSVQASFDDGETWKDARVIGRVKDRWDTGGYLPSAAAYQEFRVVLVIPKLQRTNGFVTLRVWATDASGGTVNQTIYRAYILK